MSSLLVASAGGHLKQLYTLAQRFGLDDERVWVSFESAQAISLLENEDVRHAYAPTTRNVRNAARNAILARRIIREVKPTRVISTGAGIAVPFLTVAALNGIEAHYIESATRVTGPSLSGRMLETVPGVRMYTQSRWWADKSWHYRGSVFDGFEAEEGTPKPVRRVVVTVGTDRFQFDRLFQALRRVIPSDVSVVWQVGASSAKHLEGDARESLPSGELEQFMRDADVVVAHSGTGSALAAIEAGKRPILVPRLSAFGEAIDDHQQQIASALEERQLAITRAPGDLTYDDLSLAARFSVVRRENPPAFVLGDLDLTDATNPGYDNEFIDLRRTVVESKDRP